MIKCGEHEIKVLPYTNNSLFPFIPDSAQVQIKNIKVDYSDDYFFDIYSVEELDALIAELNSIRDSFND